MEKKRFSLDWIQAPLSAAVESHGMIFVSGHTGARDVEGRPVDGDIRAQTERCLKNIVNTLALADASLSDVVKVTVFLKRAEDFDAMNEVYREFFSEGYPARSTIQCGLVRENMLIEIECIAHMTQTVS